MKLIDMEVKRFIQEIDSKSPAPGGGSVSALSATLGVALTKMVGHLSVEKKKFLALDPAIQIQFHQIMKSLDTIKEDLYPLIDQDTDAFNLIMQAFGLPKSTDDEINHRNQKIEAGTIEAIRVPSEVAKMALKAMVHLPFVIKYGNRQTASDLGVAALMLASGIEGACLNISINLPGLSDKKKVEEYRNHVKTWVEQATRIKSEVLELVYAKIA
ncbi:MAG: cyclodeaminase/cyclohydrolase family protein [Acholeplasmataceae bacterium]|nr:cyclodeaminase/cyclohydrolase family protein [Acholeplasmataceae bacterium]